MKTLVRLSIAMIIFTASCAKAPISDNTQDVDDPTTPKVKGMEDMNVSANFNWKTYKDVNLNLTGTENSIVKVSSEDGVIYQKAYLRNDSYQMKLTVPAYEKNVKISYMGKEVSLDISSGNVTHVFD